MEAEITAWGVVEVASRQDASEVKGWGSHEFRGLAHEGKWYRLRRWALDYRRFSRVCSRRRSCAAVDRKTPLAHPGRSQAVLGVGDNVGR